jgi:hypothetical protein
MARTGARLWTSSRLHFVAMDRTRTAPAPGQLQLGLDADPRAIASVLWVHLSLAWPGSIVIPELGLSSHRARVDLAHVSHRLSGFEIKGSRDDLHRLAHQIPAFSATFERMTAVVASRHIAEADRMIPWWWGLMVVEPGGLSDARPAAENPRLDRRALAALLWRDEAAAVMERHVGHPVRGTRRALIDQIADQLPPEAIGAAVRDAIRLRTGWRTAA